MMGTDLGVELFAADLALGMGLLHHGLGLVRQPDRARQRLAPSADDRSAALINSPGTILSQMPGNRALEGLRWLSAIAVIAIASR
jgi:hypothetical protein